MPTNPMSGMTPRLCPWAVHPAEADEPWDRDPASGSICMGGTADVDVYVGNASDSSASI